MHAVVVEVHTEPGYEQEAASALEEHVLPQMRVVPGIVAGYWLSPGDGPGLTVLVFDDQAAAVAIADGLPSFPRPEFAKLGSIEVRAVAASL